jgi:hypothetical protein
VFFSKAAAKAAAPVLPTLQSDKQSDIKQTQSTWHKLLRSQQKQSESTLLKQKYMTTYSQKRCKYWRVVFFSKAAAKAATPASPTFFPTYNVCRVVFFSNATANATAPVSPTLQPDEQGDFNETEAINAAQTAPPCTWTKVLHTTVRMMLKHKKLTVKHQ